MTSTFCQARLEGRALEHVLAVDTASGIRMREDSTGKWAVVKTQGAKAALQYMKVRGKEVMEQLVARGLICSGGDVPVIFSMWVRRQGCFGNIQPPGLKSGGSSSSGRRLAAMACCMVGVVACSLEA